MTYCTPLCGWCGGVIGSSLLSLFITTPPSRSSLCFCPLLLTQPFASPPPHFANSTPLPTPSHHHPFLLPFPPLCSFPSLSHSKMTQLDPQGSV
ncbi:hypothetical protein IWX49DRAFT_568965 [Phyllosticta citricarpa]